jgi:uncharacterized membrane protein
MNVFLHPGSKVKKLYFAMFLLSIAAVVVTVLLIQAHYQVSEVGSFCNINDYWNCDRVNKSIFAEILGIPVSILGFLYYIFLTTLYFGLIKGFDFGKKLLPFSPRLLLTLMTVAGMLSTLGILAYEFTVLKNYIPLILIEALVFLVLYFFIYRYSIRHGNQLSAFLGFLGSLTLFGVSFAFYLTNLELFVLQAFCIYCLTQQIIVLIIFILNLTVLKHVQNTPTLASGSK